MILQTNEMKISAIVEVVSWIISPSLSVKKLAVPNKIFYIIMHSNIPAINSLT